MEKKFGKKYLSNEEFDLDNSEYEKLEDLKKKLKKRQEEIEEILEKTESD